MSLVLNSNISSLNAQNNLTGSQALLSTSLERLSSGLKINSAADDAAGLAISQQFTTQINGTNQAISNANDAVSEAQTTSGALTTIVNNLQSIRTLAVEAANGSNSASDRSALNNQVQQQIDEISQIAQQTTFNGLNVLNGSSGTTVYQVGANVGDTIAVSLQQGVGASQIGQYSQSTGTAVTGALTDAETVSLSDGVSTVTVGPTANYVGATPYQGATSAYAAAAAINGAGLQGLTASAATTFTSAFTTTQGDYDLLINGVSIYNVADAPAGITADQVVNQINLFTGTTGVTASVSTSGVVSLSNTDGSDIEVEQNYNDGGFSLSSNSGTNAFDQTFNGVVTLTDSSPVTIKDAGSTSGGAAQLGFSSGFTTSLSTTASGTTATQSTGTAVTGPLTSTQTVSLSDGVSTVIVGPTVDHGTNRGVTSAYAAAAAINAAGLQGLTASAATKINIGVFTPVDAFDPYTLSINGAPIYNASDGTQVISADDVVSNINRFTVTTGVTATLDSTTDDVTLSNTDGSDIDVTQTSVTYPGSGTLGGPPEEGFTTLGSFASANSTSYGYLTTVTTTSTGAVTLTDSSPVTIKDVGNPGGAAALGFTSGFTTSVSGTTTGATATLANQNVLTVAGANSTIASVDAALATVSAFQSQLGAIQNRFTAAVSNLTSTAQNLTQSRSTIQDADFAAETANLAQAQVLEQAGISVLAQANQQPQLILKLLQ